MPHKKIKKHCWFCSKPYIAARPENRMHAECRKAHRKQVAAENAMLNKIADGRRHEIPITSDELVERLEAIFSDEEVISGGTLRVPMFTEPKAAPLEHSLRIVVIPDIQAKSDVDLDHLEHIGKYIAQKQFDTVVCIGDFADMESLCSYDRGKKSFEGRRYKKDIDVARHAMDLLMNPIASQPGYAPRLVLTLGNHEERILRAVEEDARLDGTIGIADLGYEGYGWDVIPFLEPVEIAGISFAHYFTSGAYQRPVTSAKRLLTERMGSAVMGHVQHFDYAIHPKTQHFGMFVGAAHVHDEAYLGPQGNSFKRQIIVLHEAKDGRADPMVVSLDFLKRRYAS